MSERLSRENVECQISEMWNALEGLRGEDYETGARDAARVERELRAKLDAQDRLDEAAPDGLTLAKALLLFYSPDWGPERRQEWKELTGQDEATTRVLGDMARALLAKVEPQLCLMGCGRRAVSGSRYCAECRAEHEDTALRVYGAE